MNMHESQVPNTVTFIYKNGDNYSFHLDFNDLNNYQELIRMWSNPNNWTGIHVASGDTSLHFINMHEVRHIRFSVKDKTKVLEFMQKQTEQGILSMETVNAVTLGILVPKSEVPESLTPPQRVRDIPSDPIK